MRECWRVVQDTNKNVSRNMQELWGIKWMGAVISLAKRDNSSVIQHYLHELEKEDDQTNGEYYRVKVDELLLQSTSLQLEHMP